MDPNDQKKTACYDIDVEVDDTLKTQMNSFLLSTASQQEIAGLDNKVRFIILYIFHTFFRFHALPLAKLGLKMNEFTASVLRPVVSSCLAAGCSLYYLS